MIWFVAVILLIIMILGFVILSARHGIYYEMSEAREFLCNINVPDLSKVSWSAGSASGYMTHRVICDDTTGINYDAANNSGIVDIMCAELTEPELKSIDTLVLCRLAPGTTSPSIILNKPYGVVIPCNMPSFDSMLCGISVADTARKIMELEPVIFNGKKAFSLFNKSDGYLEYVYLTI